MGLQDLYREATEEEFSEMPDHCQAAYLRGTPPVGKHPDGHYALFCGQLEWRAAFDGVIELLRKEAT